MSGHHAQSRQMAECRREVRSEGGGRLSWSPGSGRRKAGTSEATSPVCSGVSSR